MTWPRVVLLPLLVLAVALGVTWIAWNHERQAARRELLSQFDFSLGDAVSRIEQRMDTYAFMLRGVQSLYESGGQVSRERFHDYVRTLSQDAGFAGIQAVGVVDWVPGPQKAEHVAAMRRLVPGYAIQPAGTRNDYAPIVQREPDQGRNRAAPGLDAWFDPVRRRALEQARDSGLATLSGKVRLAVDTEANPRPGFIMYLPVYARGAALDTVAERRARLTGWVYASFRMHDVMASLYGEDPPGLSIAIYDGVGLSPARLLHRISGPGGRHLPTDLSAKEYLVVCGHDWTLSITAHDDFKTRFGRDAAPVIAIAGTGLSLLLALLAWLMMTGQGRAQRLASTMTKELRENEEKIRELAYFDALTKLPNRSLLLERLKLAIATSAEHGASGALLFIDLDQFKTLNDTLGHDVGDRLLQQVAQRLSASMRKGDTVARVGGDEFVVVAVDLPPDPAEAADRAKALGEKIRLVLDNPYRLGEIEYRITASIGATVFRGHRATMDELLKQADLAMYKSKERGRNAVRLFAPDMKTFVMERVALEAALREAIESDQFELHYQAQLDRNRITGAEALLRWRQSARGIVLPDDFIPLAEETGLIVALGNRVLELACAQLVRWERRPVTARLTIAVNVSVQQFRRPDFVDKVLEIIERSGARPDRLTLELTESVLVDNAQDIILKMRALKARGIVFALDDFGVGYSSLSYLKRLPLDQLKIDRSFVRDVLVDPNDATIARTIVALASSLGLEVIAEGVETEAQRDFLAASGCHAFQGYYFCRPLPIEEFETMLDEFERLGQAAELAR